MNQFFENRLRKSGRVSDASHHHRGTNATSGSRHKETWRGSKSSPAPLWSIRKINEVQILLSSPVANTDRIGVYEAVGATRHR